LVRGRRNQIFVHNVHPRGAALTKYLALVGRRSLAALGLENCELSIALVEDEAIRSLNWRWRKKNQATDVLSFPGGRMPARSGARRMLGDVVISLDTARKRVGSAKIKAELSRYLVHGILHLLGYDHERPSDARRMAEREGDLLGTEGLVPSRAKSADAQAGRRSFGRARRVWRVRVQACRSPSTARTPTLQPGQSPKRS
jgi:probable rRNA maturation factor